MASFKVEYTFGRIGVSDSVRHYDNAGILHRIDGPAIEYDNGGKRYFIHGIEYSFEEWERVCKLQAFQ